MNNKEVTIKLTVDKWNVVMHALGERPFAQVASLIQEIKTQADPQVFGDGAEAAANDGK